MTGALAFLYGGALAVIGTAWGVVRGIEWLANLDNDLEL